MKQVINAKFRSLCLLFSACLFQTMAWAQDSGGVSKVESTTTSTLTETTSYGEPWMWIVGGAVLLLVLVMLFRGKSTNTSSDSVRVTKTVERDTN